MSNTKRLINAAREFTREVSPKFHVRTIRLEMADGRELVLPVAESCGEEDDAKPWEPNELQKDILEALAGRSYPRIAELAAAVGVSAAWLYQGGLGELRDRGLVVKGARIGYHRPDAPPT